MLSGAEHQEKACHAVTGLRKALAEKFDDELKFFKGWIDKPKSVGSIVPTSSIAARRMASVVDPHPACRCSKSDPAPVSSPARSWRAACKPENLYPVEYSTDFVRHLRRNYPGVNVIQGDAFDLDATLGEGAAWSSIASSPACRC